MIRIQDKLGIVAFIQSVPLIGSDTYAVESEVIYVQNRQLQS